MRQWQAVALALLAGAGIGRAEDLVIQSFLLNGQVTFHAIAGASAYQVQGAPGPEGPWTNLAGGPAAPAGGSGIVTASVSMLEPRMLYRVAASLGDIPAPDGFSLIPAGSFLMGSPPDELGRQPDETPHPVTLSRAFYLQQTEVTNQQMADVLNWALDQGLITVDSAGVRNAEGDPQELTDLDDPDCQLAWDGDRFTVQPGLEPYPCIEVTGYGAQAYCNYLSDRDGLPRAVSFADWHTNPAAVGYRLPTEAEWEYACRAGTLTAFHTGEITYTGDTPLDPNLDAAGWYVANSTNPSNPMDGRKGTHPVGLKAPNAFGLFDMHGNVYERCADWYGSYPAAATDPVGPPSGSSRVVRGGAWAHDAQSARAARRQTATFGGSGNLVGFRPARSATP